MPHSQDGQGVQAMKGGKKKALSLIEGGAVLVGTADADQFALREGDGDITVEGFQAGIDRILTDYNSYSDVVKMTGQWYDGLTFTDFAGQTHYTITAVDANGDGIADTRIQVNEDSITLLGVGPDSLYSGSLMGG
jgi:hypothetical protein